MGGGWGDGCDHLHGLGGPAHAMNWLDNNIMTLVTFIPAAAGVLLLFAPRRDCEIRAFAVLVSLLTFVLSFHLPAHFYRSKCGFQFERDLPWIAFLNFHYQM